MEFTEKKSQKTKRIFFFFNLSLLCKYTVYIAQSMAIENWHHSRLDWFCVSIAFTMLNHAATGLEQISCILPSWVMKIKWAGASMQALRNNFFQNIQGWEPFRKWHHIQVGTSLPLRASLHSATHQSKVLWGFWRLHEATCLWEASLHLLLSELGGHGQPLLDQAVHRGKQSAASDISVGLLSLFSSI